MHSSNRSAAPLGSRGRRWRLGRLARTDGARSSTSCGTWGYGISHWYQTSMMLAVLFARTCQRHAGENRHPGNGFWIPACAGMPIFCRDTTLLVQEGPHVRGKRLGLLDLGMMSGVGDAFEACAGNEP